jgi:DNA polymerase-2
VSQALEIVIKKRARYKELKRKATEPCMKARYDSRQDVLKWINVTSFGYLGFNNAKFGRIDAHIAVCAFDRKILLQAAKIVEEHGFEVIHGIVDSLWIQKSAASPEDYICVKEAIEKETGFALLFEGVYKWIVFSRSKMSDELPVANRYFGVFGGDGGIKIRGIEARRHDTPPLFVRFQKEVIKIMARGNSVAEVKNLMPEVWNIFCKYRQQLREKRVRLSDLVFTKSLSKDSSAYTANTVEASAVRQLEEKGKRLHAGEVVQYVITSYRAKDPKRRTIPVELVDLNNYKDDRTGCYDAEKYIELLAYVCNSITEPFGFPVTATMERHADLYSPTV